LRLILTLEITTMGNAAELIETEVLEGAEWPAKTQIIKFNVTKAEIVAKLGEYRLIDFTTPEGYDKGRKAIAMCVGTRTGIEEKRVELKAPSIVFGRKVDAVAKEYTALITPVEEELVAKRKVVDDEKARVRAEKEAREKAERERIEREEREAREKVERERREAEQAEIARQKAEIEAERAKIAKEREEIEARAKAEREAREAEERKAREAREAAERAKQAKRDEAARLDRERVEAEQKAERERLAAERRKLEDEQKAERDRAAAERQKIEEERRAVEREKERVALSRGLWVTVEGKANGPKLLRARDRAWRELDVAKPGTRAA